MVERDPEIAAMEAVVEALGGLDDAARSRVMAYVAQRLNMAAGISSGVAAPRLEEPEFVETPLLAQGVSDIRTLREQKSPKSAQEMAAVVAYYLSELAPVDERKPEVSTADLEKYFKQAGHPLPGALQFTLKNAAAAGYFDSLGSGRYKLNPVGHNLVAHTLPKSATETASRTKRASRNTATKSKAKPKASGKARVGGTKKR